MISEKWPCGCKPYSSNPMEHCPEHRLTLGSLEQRIHATTKYLENLTKKLVEKRWEEINK